MKLRCAIIDDEPLAVELLKSYADKIPYLEVKGTFNSAIDAFTLINNGEVDLLFLDINMPQINGLEFSKTLSANIKVIFTTAYDQYAIEGFRLNALDYLLKPISYASFLEASNRALEWFKVAGNNNTTNIFVKSGYRIEKIEFNDIVYIENQKDYVKFHVENQAEPISSLMSMQSLADKLPARQFMRVHRSFIVNLDKVRTIERNCVVFGKIYIPVSESYKDKFMEFLDKNFF